MAAPVLEKCAKQRRVKFPKGSWQGSNGILYEGSCYADIEVDMDSILYFKNIK